jgi:hypothetical protein
VSDKTLSFTAKNVKVIGSAHVDERVRGSDGQRFIVLRVTPAVQAANGKTITVTRDAQGRLLVRPNPDKDIGSWPNGSGARARRVCGSYRSPYPSDLVLAPLGPVDGQIVAFGRSKDSRRELGALTTRRKRPQPRYHLRRSRATTGTSHFGSRAAQRLDKNFLPSRPRRWFLQRQPCIEHRRRC